MDKFNLFIKIQGIAWRTLIHYYGNKRDLNLDNWIDKSRGCTFLDRNDIPGLVEHLVSPGSSRGTLVHASLDRSPFLNYVKILGKW